MGQYKRGHSLGTKACNRGQNPAKPGGIIWRKQNTSKSIVILITQRSRVQIPPPQPLTKTWGRKGVDKLLICPFFIGSTH